jgi:hypothetical protein
MIVVHLIVLLSIAIYFIAPIFAPTGTKEIVKIGGVVLLALSILLEGVTYGIQSGSSDLKSQIDKLNAENAALKVKSEQVTTRIVTQYVDRVKVVTTQGEDRVVYVDRLITPQDNADCKLPPAFFLLLNSGAENTDPSSAIGTLGTPSRNTENNTTGVRP